jgi:acetyl esterase/lipase
LIPRIVGRRQFLAAALTLPAALAGCSPLTAFNSLIPHDEGAVKAGRNVRYGREARQTLDIYVPEAGAAGAPVLIFFYGGSWNSGRKEDYGFVGDAFASRGFIAIIPDYRLVPAVRFPTFLADLALAVRWGQDNAERFGGDPRRIVFLGHSAGAYNAVMLALDRRYLDAAGVDGAGIRGVTGLSGPYDFYPFDDPAAIAAFAAHPAPRQTQPIAFVRTDAPPAFLGTGDEDGTVRPRNTHVLAEKLRAAGAGVVEKVYPGLGHIGTLLALSRYFRDGPPVLKDVVAFLEAHVGTDIIPKGPGSH